MIKTITYDDTLYQLVPKEPVTKLLARYEEMRQWCMRMGNQHPDSNLCCHQSLGTYGTATEHGMALLLDDMALALSVAPTPPAQPEAVRVPLTREQIQDIWLRDAAPGSYPEQITRAIEAAHGITAAAPKQENSGG